MSLFGSSSSSGGGFFGSGAKSSKTTSTTTSQSAGFSELGTGANAFAVQGNVTGGIQTSDFGAIDAARQISQAALQQVELAGRQATDTVQNALSSTSTTVGNAIGAVAQSARAETENILIQGFKYLSVVGAIFAIAYGVRAFAK